MNGLPPHISQRLQICLHPFALIRFQAAAVRLVAVARQEVGMVQVRLVRLVAAIQAPAIQVRQVVHRETEMITPKEAEALATAKVQEYVNACGCNDLQDVGNALLKLLSVTGQAMIATQGRDVALAMVEGTHAHLSKPEFDKAYKMETVQ